MDLLKTKENLSFAERYNINPEDYHDVAISECNFSVRVHNALMRNNITTVEAILKLSEENISKIKNLGKNSVAEIVASCAKLNDGCEFVFDGSKSIVAPTSNPLSTALLKKHRDDIAIGDFSFVDENNYGIETANLVNIYKQAFETVGYELAIESIYSPEKITPIIFSLFDFSRHSTKSIELNKIFLNIPEYRKNNKAYGYIQAFTTIKGKRTLLYSLCENENATLADMYNPNIEYNQDLFRLLKDFFKWCCFDLQKEIEWLFGTLYTKESDRTVIQMRTTKHTLEEAGQVLGVTRERIRQKEAKVKLRFSKLYSKVLAVSKISAERNGDQVITPAEIEEYCGDVTTELVFLLQSYPSPNYTYDKELDVFIVGDDSMRSRAQDIIDTYPELVSETELEPMLIKSQEEYDITIEFLEKAFMNIYRRKGDTYYKNGISLAKIYEKVITEHYPDGFRVYDNEELNTFRAIITSEYGDIGLPENNRPLSARISAICILCGRGKYRVKQKEYIPKSLAKKIYDYINNSESQIFLTNTLFSLFEDELLAAGVDNKYFLQGILRELYEDKFFFSRDYISKDKNITSLNSSLISFIKQFDFPVPKDKICEAFPGITEIVINFATSDPSIINYFGEYLHESKLNIFDRERLYLYNIVNRLVSDNKVHHSKELYDAVFAEMPDTFTRNYAMYPYQVFSLAENILRNDFLFSRPYFAEKDIEIERASDRLRELIYSQDTVSFDKIREFSKEAHFNIPSLLEYANDCNDEFFLENNNSITRIELTGINEEIALKVDNIIADSISQTLPVKEISVWAQLPSISSPWTDWLVYSAINKWGKRTRVGVTSNQIKMATPLIAPIDNYDPTPFIDTIQTKQQSASFTIDDLNNIDSLIEDIIDEDILGDYEF